MKQLFVADFETTTTPDDCRVWGWGLYNIKKDVFKCGTTIDKFFKVFLKAENKSIFYFHNLKFDGEFILYHLFRNGFNHSKEKDLKHKEFSTLITFMGVFYAIKIQYNNKEFHIYDSLKIIPLSVSVMSKAFKLHQLKGDIDYHKLRTINHQLTEKEISYIKNDVEIVGKSLLYFFNQKLTKMTQASNAFYDYKKITGYKKFEKYFPVLEMDKEIRQAYKGGFAYVNPKFKNRVLGGGVVLDVNSLYPSVMYNKKLPYGEPRLFTGKYKTNNLYDLYVQIIRCNFEIKPGFIPTLQLKHNMSFKPTDYVTSSDGLDVTMCLTSVDLDLFLKHYDVYNLEYFNGWMFKSTNSLFKKYIDKWVKVKNDSTISGNNGLRTLSKLMLNSLYGKFGLNPEVKSKIPSFDGELIHYSNGEKESRKPVYIPVACFITAYSREITITSAQKNYSRFIYADTDSLHLLGFELPENIEIDSVKMGCWKHEGNFTKSKFIRAKTYIEEIDSEIHVACAGLPKKCQKLISFDNFKTGLVIPGKLQHKRVKGGVILKEIDFTIKI